MKRLGGWLLVLVLAGAVQAMAAGLITKKQAEQDALNAVGGGTVISAMRDRTPKDKKIWSVDIAGASHEYEVWVDAHNGAILQIITQPFAPQGKGLMSKAEAEQIALNAVGGGQVLQAVLDRNMGRKTWSVDVLGTANEYEVWVDAHSGAVLKIITQPLAPIQCTFLSKKQAEAIALAAVNANKVLSARLEKKDNPIVWSVDVRTQAGAEYEVKVDACSGKVVAIITGG
jgi:uncharacterized membrane protein YkoI